MKRLQTGTTRQVFWINSDTVPTNMLFNLIDGAETVITSAPMVSSGNGHYYYDMTVPDSEGYYTAQVTCTIGLKPYKNKTPFRAVLEEVN